MMKLGLLFFCCLPLFGHATPPMLRCTDIDGRNLSFATTCPQGKIQSSIKTLIQMNSNTGQDYHKTNNERSETLNGSSSVFLLPIKFSIKGGNFTSEISIDENCIFRGQIGNIGAGPDIANLALMKLVSNWYGRSESILKCKDGSLCAMSTRADYDLKNNRSFPTHLQKTDGFTVAIDHGIYEESEKTLKDKLMGAVNACQERKPSLVWMKLLQTARH